MTALQLAYTDTDTGASYPRAMVQIVDWRLQGSPPAAEVDLAYYVDDAAMAAGLPFKRARGVRLSEAEINTWIQQFALAGYQVLNARAEFSTATIVET
jgi:hypothetical protein